MLKENGIDCTPVKKIAEGVPNILDIIRSGIIDLIVDIPVKGNDVNSDGFKIRRVAIESDISLMTSLDTVGAMVDVMEADYNAESVNIISLSDIH